MSTGPKEETVELMTAYHFTFPERQKACDDPLVFMKDKFFIWINMCS